MITLILKSSDLSRLNKFLKRSLKKEILPSQALNEKRIAELEEKLSHARFLDDEDIPKDQALIGAKVKLKDLNSGEELQYTLVSEAEADFSQGKISITSPVGKGLLGHKKNDTVEIKTPA